jgi:cardiolipin synthase
MTIPNLITILRILLTPLVVILLLEQRLSEALLVFALASLTDGVDGFVARLYKQKSRLGALLDPLADKLLLSTTYVILSTLYLIPKWLTVIVLSRDVVILLGVFVLFLHNLPVEIKPSLASKMTTCTQIITVIVTMGSALATPHPLLKHVLFQLTGGLTMISWGQYLIRGLRMLQETGE